MCFCLMYTIYFNVLFVKPWIDEWKEPHNTQERKKCMTEVKKNNMRTQITNHTKNGRMRIGLKCSCRKCTLNRPFKIWDDDDDEMQTA